MNNLKKQSGAALIIAMVILLILTILGVTAMSTATIQERLVGNFQDALINSDCTETVIRRIREGLVGGTLKAKGGVKLDTMPNRPAQDLDISSSNCGQIVSATYQRAGETIVGINSCKVVNFEVNVVTRSPTTGSQTVRTVAYARRQLGCK